MTVSGFNPIVPIQTPKWLECNDIFHFSQAYLLYFRLQAKQHYHYTDRTKSGIFLCSIQHSDYANTVTTLQSHVNSYREDYDTGFLPPHLRLYSLAKSIHQNAQKQLRDFATPHVRRLDMGTSLIQGLPWTPPLSPSINRLGRTTGNGDTSHDRNGGGGYLRGDRDQLRDRWDGYRCNPATCGQSRATRGHLAHPDWNRCPFLPDVQCAACKRIGHAAKHCNMLATTICLERYMKHDLSSTVCDSIKKDWLARWKERLGNPKGTP